MAPSHISRSRSTSLKCQASIEASMDLLNLDMGRLSLPAESCLFSLLGQCFTKIRDIFDFNDPSGILAEQSSLERILNSVFDNTSLPFVTEKSVRIAAGLDDHDKSCLFMQAVAGLVMIFCRLGSAGVVISGSMFSRELQLFAECDQRRAVLDMIGGSSLFSSCYTKGSIVNFIMAAMDEGEVQHHDNVPSKTADEDLLRESVAWVSNRPCKNMGLPWGFTIMAIN